MTQTQWKCLTDFRDEFKLKCSEWSEFSSDLLPLQKEACLNDTPSYPIENSVVYNTALDKLTQTSKIKLILIGDNPGKQEQLNINKRYLTGQAGKLAERFFLKNPDLSVNFRNNVLILNKTPIHTAKTKHIKYLLRNGSPEIRTLITESQIWMAEKTAELHKTFCSGENKENAGLWLVGYSEIKKNGVFEDYRKNLEQSYKMQGNYYKAWEKILVFQHFSMNRFSIDLDNYMQKHNEKNTAKALTALGTCHKNEIF